MKKSIVVLLLSFVLLLTAAPLLADQPTPVGARVDLLGGTPDTLPAGEPFFVGQGWVFDNEAYPPGHFNFQLEVDGVLQHEDHFFVRPDDPFLIRFWVFNYEGMSGTHTFTGHWICPCQFAVDMFGYPGPCENPNTEVEVINNSLTVNFTP